MKSRGNKLRVIHVVNSFQQGGAERQLATIINHSMNTENYLLSLKALGSGYLDDEKNVRIVSADSIRGRVIELRKHIAEIRPEVIYTWGNLPYILSVLATIWGAPKIINGSIRHGIFKKSLNGYLRMFLLHLSRNIVANSHSGLRANRIRRGWVLYNGVDPKFDIMNFHAQASGSVSETTVLVSVANLVPYKDYFTVLNALHMLKKEGFKFIYQVIGDGPKKDDILRFIHEHDLDTEVTLLGRVNHPEKHLARSHIFIHSSKGEGCSNAILEAMYMGLPVIASDTGGTKEIVSDNAILFEYQNVGELFKAVKKLMIDSEQRMWMAQKSYHIAKERFSVQRMISDYEMIVSKIYAG